jgi:hypothetical protein
MRKPLSAFGRKYVDVIVPDFSSVSVIVSTGYDERIPVNADKSACQAQLLLFTDWWWQWRKL